MELTTKYIMNTKVFKLYERRRCPWNENRRKIIRLTKYKEGYIIQEELSKASSIIQTKLFFKDKI